MRASLTKLSGVRVMRTVINAEGGLNFTVGYFGRVAESYRELPRTCLQQLRFQDLVAERRPRVCTETIVQLL